MKVIVCLGNPGIAYERTRHNIGFLTADKIITHYNLQKAGKKFKGVIYEGFIGSEKLLLLKPMTYMNASGESVSLLLNYYKLAFEDVVIIFDDIDLTLGKIRVRATGSAGTHNGMRNIVQQCGSKDIPRVRQGIGPKAINMALDVFVLDPFKKDEWSLVEKIYEKTIVALDIWINEGVQVCMNRANIKD